MDEKIKNKKEMMNKKKFDGFAIASFVLAIAPILLFIFIISIREKIPNLILNYNVIKFFNFLPLSFVLSILFAIMGLIRIKGNKNLKGKQYAIGGLTISLLVLILSILTYLGFNNINFID